MSTYCQTLCHKHNARRRCFLHDCFALCVNARFMLASRGKAAAAEAAASKRGRRRGCGRVAVRVGVRDGHRVRCISWWRAAWTRRRFVILAAWSSGGRVWRWSLHGATHALPLSSGGALATDGADADRPRPARAGGEQCSQSAALATTVLSLGGARAAGLSNVRSRPGLIWTKPCGASYAVELRCRALLSSCAVELCGRAAMPSCVGHPMRTSGANERC